jgi:hypothetical protein
MTPTLISEEYSLVIDTNGEAYDFAPKLCAYCTGLTAEDEVDRQYSDLFYMEMGIDDDDSPHGKVADEKNPFAESAIDRRDENDVFSPCSVWLSREYGSNEAGEYAKLTTENYSEFDLPAPFSVGIFFDVEPTKELVQIVRERATKFFAEVWPKISKQTVKVMGLRLISHKKYAEEKEL